MVTGPSVGGLLSNKTLLESSTLVSGVPKFPAASVNATLKVIWPSASVLRALYEKVQALPLLDGVTLPEFIGVPPLENVTTAAESVSLAVKVSVTTLL